MSNKVVVTAYTPKKEHTTSVSGAYYGWDDAGWCWKWNLGTIGNLPLAAASLARLEEKGNSKGYLRATVQYIVVDEVGAQYGRHVVIGKIKPN